MDMIWDETLHIVKIVLLCFLQKDSTFAFFNLIIILSYLSLHEMVGIQHPEHLIFRIKNFVRTKEKVREKNRQGSWENNWTCWTTASNVCAVLNFRKSCAQHFSHSYTSGLTCSTLWDLFSRYRTEVFLQRRNENTELVRLSDSIIVNIFIWCNFIDED